MREPNVTISRRGEERVHGGHPWIYRSDLTNVSASGGDTVVVFGSRGKRIGRALFSDASQISLRMLVRGDAPADLALWRRRLEQAVERRRALAIDADAYRLVHAEGDLLPSLVVDRYGDVLVVQALSQGTDRRLPDVVRLLLEIAAPSGILLRNDARVRALEGLAQTVEVAHGDVPAEVVARFGGISLAADLRGGQKTGLFLDQRENWAAAAAYARGRCFDGFSYDGGFALHIASRASEVVAVDISEDAVSRTIANAARNGSPNVTARAANVFDVLRDAERAGERFDTIVLDPPAFAKSRAALGNALSGYKEINLRALKLLAPGGHLVTCSCSYHVSEQAFADMLLDAAIDARVAVTLVEQRGQSRDHPVLLGVPETSYLKCFILRRLPE